jgi:uncharacterized protein DUF4214
MKTQISNLKRLDIVGNADCSSDRDIFTGMLKQWRQKLGYCSIFAAIPAVLATHVYEARSDEVKRTEANVAGKGARRHANLNKSISNPTLLKRQSEFRLPHQKSNFAMLAPFAGKDDCPGFTIPQGSYTAANPFVDSGDTTGANNTVFLFYIYPFPWSSFGPDHVYSFTLTGRGPNPRIEVSTTSNSYKPLIYVLEGGFSEACPAGTGKEVYNTLLAAGALPNGTATIDTQMMNYLPLNVPLHLFIDGDRDPASGPYTIRIQDVQIAPETCTINPMSCTAFFVRQHYLDFLGRLPDEPGQNFWTDNVTKCTDPARRPGFQTEAECIDTQKVNTSAAFILSPEFQYTGYYVYRLYKGSLIRNGAGRVPNYYEFQNDRWWISDGIVQNNQLSATKIEANKKKFAEGFTQRAEFRSLYDSLSNFDYVERLFQNTGVSVTAQEKQALVQGLNNQTETRGSVLQKIVDGTVVMGEGNQQFTTSYGRAFYEKEFNSAFVLMEYFGYLHRDPDAAGYQHWLDKLNFYGNYSDAEMVRSFISSPEYRARFGQP